jgi:hypothetical protein
MCNLVYEISVGKMQHFPGNQECILPTDFWPTCHFAYKIGKFVVRQAAHQHQECGRFSIY